MINGFCVNVIAVKTGPVQFDREHQSKGGETKAIGGLKQTIVKVRENTDSIKIIVYIMPFEILLLQKY